MTKKLDNYIEMARARRIPSPPYDEVGEIVQMAKLNPAEAAKLRKEMVYIAEQCSEAVSDILGNNFPNTLNHIYDGIDDQDVIDEMEDKIRELTWKYVRSRL